MTRGLVFLSLLLFSPILMAQGGSAPILAPEPSVLLAQIDDSDLKDEESLKQLMQIEYNKDAMSMGAAVGSSFIPGAGWGLIYAKKDLQASVPFAISIIGYGLGIAYMAGAFNTSSTAICTHERDGRVNDAECTYAEIPRDPNAGNRTDKNTPDPRSEDGMQPYFRTAADYSTSVVGKDFNGFDTGIIVLVSTYVLTTALGAVWAGSTVSKHNEQLRKDIESTAQRRTPRSNVSARPIVQVDHQGGLFGFSLSF
ncbi:MAG: hypothetical protein VYA30_08025 [Myxococcota bacterium]|nr:hypothetical protein [Myxococcota bacterium]